MVCRGSIYVRLLSNRSRNIKSKGHALDRISLVFVFYSAPEP